MVNKLRFVKAFTLTEIIIAISLMSFVLLSIAVVEVSTRKMLGNVDDETVLLMEAATAMAHMEKNIARATGDITNPGGVLPNGSLGINISGSNPSLITFRVDDSSDPTPEDYSDDILMKYEKDGSALRYYPTGSGSSEALTNRLTALTFSAPFVQYPYTGDFFVTINMVARFDPAQPAGPDNPSVQFDSNVCPRSHSIN